MKSKYGSKNKSFEQLGNRKKKGLIDKILHEYDQKLSNHCALTNSSISNSDNSDCGISAVCVTSDELYVSESIILEKNDIEIVEENSPDDENSERTFCRDNDPEILQQAHKNSGDIDVNYYKNMLVPEISDILGEWIANEKSMSHHSVDRFLSNFRIANYLVPKSTKTLIKSSTPNVTNMDHGEYVHFDSWTLNLKEFI